MKARYLLLGALTLAVPVATACSVFTPRFLYVNVVRLDGPKIEGLKWVRIYNILDYEGADRVMVSALSQGRRVPVARWENGQECAFDTTGQEKCQPNQPESGIGVEALFPNWTEASDRRDSLKKLYLPLIVQVDGREIPMTLRSRPVRNNRKLQEERAGKTANDVCWRMD